MLQPVPVRRAPLTTADLVNERQHVGPPDELQNKLEGVQVAHKGLALIVRPVERHERPNRRGLLLLVERGYFAVRTQVVQEPLQEM